MSFYLSLYQPGVTMQLVYVMKILLEIGIYIAPKPYISSVLVVIPHIHIYIEP